MRKALTIFIIISLMPSLLSGIGNLVALAAGGGGSSGNNLGQFITTLQTLIPAALLLLAILAILYIMNLTKGRVMEGKLSFLEWLGLALLFIGLPGAIAIVVSFSIPYYLLHNVTLANTLSTIIPIVVFGISVTYFWKYLQSRNLVTPFMKRRSIIILPDSGQPIDEKYIRSFEVNLKFVKGEEYINQLAMLGMMYLQNAVAYDNKDLYLRAKEYLARAEETMEEKSVSFETKMLVDNLRSRIETYKYRFGER
ncbi:MAG: hypothetical protein RXO22_09310 [Thermocladium sp.]